MLHVLVLQRTLTPNKRKKKSADAHWFMLIVLETIIHKACWSFDNSQSHSHSFFLSVGVPAEKNTRTWGEHATCTVADVSKVATHCNVTMSGGAGGLPRVNRYTHIQTFTVPWQEPWAGDIDSGSWKSIRPAGVQVKGPVTHQPCGREQISEMCAEGSL